MDQSKGEDVSGPHKHEEQCLKIQLQNTSILAEQEWK